MLKIKHNFKSECFIPYSALEDNIGFLCEEGDNRRITDDGVEVEIKWEQSYHIMSKQGQELIKRLYGMTWDKFLGLWFEKLGEHVKSLDFLHITMNIRK